MDLRKHQTWSNVASDQGVSLHCPSLFKRAHSITHTRRLTLHATEETKSGEYYSLPLSPVKSQGIDDDLTEDEDEGHDEESIDPLPSAQPQNAIRLSLGDGWDMRLEKTERDDDETEEEGSVAASVEVRMPLCFLN